VLGRLFRNDAVSVTKTNLLIFIRPTIIRDDAELAGATALKYRAIRERQRQSARRGLPFFDDDRDARAAGLGGSDPPARDHPRGRVSRRPEAPMEERARREAKPAGHSRPDAPVGTAAGD
jgi:hypothetical protein